MTLEHLQRTLSTGHGAWRTVRRASGPAVLPDAPTNMSPKVRWTGPPPQSPRATARPKTRARAPVNRGIIINFPGRAAGRESGTPARSAPGVFCGRRASDTYIYSGAGDAPATTLHNHSGRWALIESNSMRLDKREEEGEAAGKGEGEGKAKGRKKPGTWSWPWRDADLDERRVRLRVP